MTILMKMDDMAPYLDLLLVSPLLLFCLSWAPDGCDLFLSICLFDTWESAHCPPPTLLTKS